MDSISNLPLLEITAEDDSLLFDGDEATTSSAANAASATATTVFSCSPLLSLRSLPRTDGRVGALVSENVSSATNECASYKENVNWNNKPEAPKLSVEPQQMKRKKKGGGYNLRKSLAWDRAFSTEEGVLNPLELSMISGTVTPKRINTKLKAIYEEEPASASSALREIEENLFKQSSDGGACLEHKTNVAAGLTPKSRSSIKDRATPSLAKRKVLAVNDVVGNIPKRNAYPPRVTSSSLKRPESAKAPNKEIKVTKIPGPKSNVSGIKTAARSGTLSSGLPKKNQSAHSGSAVTNVQKNAGAKGPPKNPRTASTNPKVDMADKCSVTRTLKKQAGKPLDSSVSETPPSLGLHPPGTQKVSEACLPQGVSDTGEKKQPRQFQTTKPSGLKMPSPSLGFFSQAKPSGSQNQLQKNSKPCKPTERNIPKLCKLEMHTVNEARLPPAPRKRSEIVEGTTNNCTKKLSLSDVKSEASMQIDNIQIAGKEVEYDSLDSEKVNKQEMVDIKQTAGLAVECHSLGLENPSGLLQPTVLGGSIQGIPSKNVEQMNDSAHDFDKVGGDLSAYLLNGNLSVNCNDPSRSTLEVVRQQLQGEQINAPNVSIVEEIISENENESKVNSHKAVHATTLSSKFSPENLIQEIDGSCESKLKVAESEDCQHSADDQSGFIQRRLMDEGCDQVIDSRGLDNRTQALELDRMYEDPSTAQMTTLYSTCSPEKLTSEMVNACESEPNIVESEDCKHPADDQSGFVQIRPLDEGYHQPIDSKVMQNRTQVFELDRMCEDSTVVHVTTLSSKCSPAKSIPEMDGASEIEDCQHPVDHQSDFTERRPVDERYKQETDSEGMNNKTQAFELDRMCEDSTAVHVATSTLKCSPAKSIPEIDDACESEPKVAKSEDCQHPVDHHSDFMERGPADDGYKQDIYSEGMSNRTQAFELDKMCEDSTAVHVATLTLKCSPAKSIPEIDGSCESEPKVAESEDCQHPLDNQSDFLERRAVDERHNLNIDSEGMNKGTQSFELDRMCEDSIAVSVTVCSTEVNNVSPESRLFNENDIENLDFAPQLCSIVKADGDSSRKEKLISDHCTISEWQLRGDGSSMETSVCCDVQSDVPRNFVQETNTLSEQQLREDSSSKDTSMDFDGFYDVPGIFEQQADSHTFSETNEMVCEDERLEANHGQLLDESEYSSVTVDFISNSEHSICGSGNNFGPQQFTVLAQTEREFDRTNRESEESHVKDELVLSFVENEHCLPATKDQLLLVGDNDKYDESHLSELQRPIVSENSQHVNTTMHLDGDGLPANTAYSEEIKQKDSFQVASEGCNICKSEDNSSNHHTQSVPESTDENNDMDARVECSQIGDMKNGSTNMLPAVEVQVNHKVISAELDSSIKMSEDSIADVVNWKSDELCSSGENLKLPVSDDLPFHTSTPQGSEVSPLNNKKNSQEPETNVTEKDDFPNPDIQNQTEGDLCLEDRKNSQEPETNVIEKDDFPDTEMQNQLEGELYLEEDRKNSQEPETNFIEKDDFPDTEMQNQSEGELYIEEDRKNSREPDTNVIVKDDFPNTDMHNQTEGDLCFEEDRNKLTDLEKSATKSKPQVPPVKIPPNAVPFSDEWLAAIEAAGEEILTIKSGAVQNSPPEKPQHEPGPWSPVKRKNQTIGPFDCTKHTIPHPDSS